MILVRNLFIFLLSLGSFWAAGQQDTSTVDWSDTYHEELQKIENLEQKGQNRSAYRRANDLFEKAINANNIPGIVGSINLFIRNIYRVDDEASKTALVMTAGTKHCSRQPRIRGAKHCVVLSSGRWEKSHLDDIRLAAPPLQYRPPRP